MTDTEDFTADGRDNLTRLLNLGRRKHPRISRRYTIIVRSLRMLLPFIALTLVVLVVAWPKMDDKISAIPKENIIPQNTGRNELLSPHFEGATKDNSPYIITAARAVQDIQDSSIILLEQPVADITAKDGNTINARSASGTYRQEQKILTLNGTVSVQDGSGYLFHTDLLNISVADRIAWTDTAVNGKGPGGSLEAKALNANNETGVIIFTGPAKLILY